MKNEVQSWPYSFPASEDFPQADQRGTISGRLLVQDRYISIHRTATRYLCVVVFLSAISMKLKYQIKTRFCVLENYNCEGISVKTVYQQMVLM